jgi:hypothetical protein
MQKLQCILQEDCHKQKIKGQDESSQQEVKALETKLKQLKRELQHAKMKLQAIEEIFKGDILKELEEVEYFLQETKKYVTSNLS